MDTTNKQGGVEIHANAEKQAAGIETLLKGLIQNFFEYKALASYPVEMNAEGNYVEFSVRNGNTVMSLRVEEKKGGAR